MANRTRSWGRRAALVLAATLAWVGAVAAQSPRGSITAFACGQPGTITSLALKSLGDSKDDLAVREKLVAALTRAGRTVAADAPAVMSVETATEVELPARKGRDLGELSSTPEGTTFRLNLWSTTRDSLIGGRKDGAAPAARRRFRIGVAIHDKASGHCLWQGEAVHLLDDTLSAPLDVMARSLVKTIGRNARSEPIPAE